MLCLSWQVREKFVYDEKEIYQFNIMVWKKPQAPDSSSVQPIQSQSISGSVTGNTVQMGQAGGDLPQSQNAETQSAQQGLTGQDLVTLLAQLETAVKTSGLSSEQQEEVLDYVRPAKREVGKEVPNKELVVQNLKQASETMKTLRDTSENGKALLETGVPIFKAIASLLGLPLF